MTRAQAFYNNGIGVVGVIPLDYDRAITLAFDEAYGRAPKARELGIAKQSIAAESNPKEGLRLFVQAMFGANDFLYSY